MGTLTVRKLDEGVKRKLREVAARRGLSTEGSARHLLQTFVPAPAPAHPAGGWRLKASIEDLLALSIKPDEPFDAKAVTDEMWEEGLR